MGVYSLMEHERKRWREMTDKQLITRLGKIKTLDKIECFIRLCHEHPSRGYLLRYAENRRAELLGSIGSSTHTASSRTSMYSAASAISGYSGSEPAPVPVREVTRSHGREKSPVGMQGVHREYVCEECGFRTTDRNRMLRPDKWLCHPCFKKRQNKGDEERFLDF